MNNSTKKKLFVISVDSLFFDDLNWLKNCPYLSSVLESGSVVQKMRSTYPAMTYVAHTTMMTGCHQEKHGIYHNEKVEPGSPHPPWHWYRNEVKVNTIFDAAKEAGYTSAVINWPVTGKDPSIDYLIPEIWSDDPAGDCRPRFLTVCSPGMEVLYDRHSHLMRWKYQPELDNFGVACLKDIIKEHRPDLMMLHLSYLDHQRHSCGGFSSEAESALMECDRKIGELFDLLREMNLFDRYNIAVMGDHGHLPVKQVFHPNVILAQKGFLTLDKKGHITDYRCFLHSAGLSAHVVLKDPLDSKTRSQMEALMNQWIEMEDFGCEQYFNKEQLKTRFHLDGPFDYVLEGRLGTAFGNNVTGDIFLPTDNRDYKLSVSAHGHMPEKGPQPIFFASGPDIKKGVVLENGTLIDEAPTYAALLGISMPWAQGCEIKEILIQNKNQEESL